MTLDFSFARLWAMITKEFYQIMRDRLTFAILLLIPLMQLIIYGYAINSNPKHLPTVIIANDHSELTRQYVASLQNSDYFKIVDANATEKKANRLLKRGSVSFIFNIPTDFTRDFIRGDKPDLLITSDATDPVTTVNAISAINGLSKRVFQLNMKRGLSYIQPGIFGQDGEYGVTTLEPPSSAAFNTIIHQKWNPEANSTYSIVSGLMGVVLTMTMVMTTSSAITRERERGTMENLLAMPILPLEVMMGKIMPYIIVGYIQQMIIVLVSTFVFHVPFNGSFLLLLIATLPFIAANLSVGILFSTVAKNQLQSVQMTFFFFLPSILLSGFMFPFFGMPYWARIIGNILPLTHFLYVTRGIMLKGNGLIDLWPHIWPLLVFTVTVILFGLKRYRRTLD